jgi:hypothetical protein
MHRQRTGMVLNRGQRTTLKCAVRDKLTTRTWLGMDMACYLAWVRDGRPDFDEWASERRSGPEPRECIVCSRPAGGQPSFGMDERCYNAWRRAGRPDLDDWVPARRKWLGYRH